MGRTTFDLSAVQRALGMKVGVGLPSMQTESMAPVVVLADFSRSFAAEAFEARGVLGASQPSPPAGNRPVVELKAISNGGVVIEEVRVFNGIVAGAPGEAVRFENDESAISVGVVGPLAETIIDVGGEDVGSEGRSFSVVGATTAGIPIQLNLSGLATVTNMGWFLPSGRVFRVSGEVNLTGVLSLSIQFREIPVHVGSE